MGDNFKRKHKVGERIKVCGDVRIKYPTRVPIICEPGRHASALALDKCKYLVPETLTMGQFSYIIRKRMKRLESHKALYLTCNGVLPCINETAGDIYRRAADKEDGLLYITYSLESTFG